MNKFENLRKQIGGFFQRKPKAKPTAPASAIPEESTPAAPILSAAEIDEIQKSNFDDKTVLLKAINKGVKIAAHSQNRSALFSEFKRDVTGWLKAYKKLKDTDFMNTKTSKNWISLMGLIRKDAEQYKKTIIKSDDDNIVVHKEDALFVRYYRYVNHVIKILTGLPRDEVNFLFSYYRFPDKVDAIKKSVSSYKSLSSIPEELDKLQQYFSVAYPEITLEKFMHMQEALSQLSDEELKYLANEAKSLAGYTSSPLEWLQTHYHNYYESREKKIISHGRKKSELNNSKVIYMNAMKKAALEALK